jgi:hypothetical protein
MVLEPLGLALLQTQSTKQQSPSLSGPATHLSNGLKGPATSLLQAMLTACLHLLVLHAQRKEQTSAQTHPSSRMQQHAALCAGASGEAMSGSSSSSSGGGSSRGGRRGSSSSKERSVPELAEGYLLQHADALQAKQTAGPAAPSRAAVMAWGVVCWGQWSARSLPLTLQAAGVLLATIQPSTKKVFVTGRWSA